MRNLSQYGALCQSAYMLKMLINMLNTQYNSYIVYATVYSVSAMRKKCMYMHVQRSFDRYTSTRQQDPVNEMLFAYAPSIC